MEWNATLKNLRISPRKTRLVADAIRGKSVRDALNILDAIHKKSSLPIKKLIQSAVSNAKIQDSMLESQLKIGTIYVDAGMTLKRFRPRAYGRAYTIRKRSSHVRLTLTELDIVKKRKSKLSDQEETKVSKTEPKQDVIKASKVKDVKSVKKVSTKKTVAKKPAKKSLTDK